MTKGIASIAFFPWVRIDEPTTIGSVRLLPYSRGIKPGNLPEASQKDMDAVLGAYASHTGKTVMDATLIEFGGVKLGQNFEIGALDAMFGIATYVTFAALAKRRMFCGHSGYCNADTYRMIVQRYESGDAGHFVFSTRRRDGCTQQLWGAEEFAFHCPLHVSPTPWNVDRPLLEALLAAPQPKNIHEAIVEFNSANTDSNDVPEHVELVMTKTAFEWLWQINHNVHKMREALIAAVDDLPMCTPFPTGPQLGQWRKRWPGRSLIEAWVRDICVARGAAAHGKDKGTGLPVWSANRHLAFAAVIFPLLLKRQLQQDGLYQLTTRDIRPLARFEGFLTYDPPECGLVQAWDTSPMDAVGVTPAVSFATKQISWSTAAIEESVQVSAFEGRAQIVWSTGLTLHVRPRPSQLNRVCRQDRTARTICWTPSLLCGPVNA